MEGVVQAGDPADVRRVEVAQHGGDAGLGEVAEVGSVGVRSYRA